eukprot:g2360.t1
MRIAGNPTNVPARRLDEEDNDGQVPGECEVKALTVNYANRSMVIATEDFPTALASWSIGNSESFDEGDVCGKVADRTTSVTSFEQALERRDGRGFGNPLFSRVAFSSAGGIVDTEISSSTVTAISVTSLSGAAGDSTPAAMGYGQTFFISQVQFSNGEDLWISFPLLFHDPSGCLADDVDPDVYGQAVVGYGESLGGNVTLIPGIDDLDENLVWIDNYNTIMLGTDALLEYVLTQAECDVTNEPLWTEAGYALCSVSPSDGEILVPQTSFPNVTTSVNDCPISVLPARFMAIGDFIDGTLDSRLSLWAMSEAVDGYSVVCMSDFPSMGYQPGEKVATLVRLASTLISVSIISSWCNKEVVGRYMLFFVHYLAGLLHQLAQMVLAEIVALCWTTTGVLRVVQALKFVELVGGNLLAITNVAICVNLALIVSSHHTMSRVKNVTSPRLILGFTVVAVLAGLAGAFFWETVMLSGTLFWNINTNSSKHDWLLTSTYFVELLAGVAMLTIGTMLVLFRWTELCQVWQFHRRIKCYIALSVIATVVDLAIGVGGVIYVLHRQYVPTLIVATWTMRHVHIGLDTLVLYSALGVTSRPDHNVRPNDGGEAPAEKAKGGDSDYNSGEFHVSRPKKHHRGHQHRQGGGGPEPALLVTAADDGRRWGSGPNAVTTSSSPDYIPEEEAV